MRYFQRSSKYFISLSVIYLAMLYMVSLTSRMPISMVEKMAMMVDNNQAILLIGALILLSLLYPYFGFMRKVVDGDITLHREQIMRTFELQGMVLHHESEGRMTFVADSLLTRITRLFEDHVKVIRQKDGGIAIVGNRKMVAYVVYRLEGAIAMSKQENV